MIFQCGILFAFLAAGELIVAATHIPIPSSIIGMLLLTAALRYRIVRPEWVDRISDLLIRNLGFFFVPAGVGLMQCLGLLGGELIPIVVTTAVSTFVIIAVTGHVHEYARHMASHSRRPDLHHRVHG